MQSVNSGQNIFEVLEEMRDGPVVINQPYVYDAPNTPITFTLENYTTLRVSGVDYIGSHIEVAVCLSVDKQNREMLENNQHVDHSSWADWAAPYMRAYLVKNGLLNSAATQPQAPITTMFDQQPASQSDVTGKPEAHSSVQDNTVSRSPKL
jgi:hypothetical protein